MKLASIRLVGLSTVLTIVSLNVGCGKDKAARGAGPAVPVATDSGVEPDSPVSDDALGEGGAALSGAELYAEHCASCHNGIDASQVSAHGRLAIEEAIDTVPEMAALKGLEEKDLAAIAEALAAKGPGRGKGRKPTK